MKFLILSALALAVHGWESDCGIAGSSKLQHIVGGQEATPGQWPWQVSLASRPGERHFCGGVIINANWIMTAAHCVEGDAPRDLFAFVGEHDRSVVNPERVRHRISNIYMHPEYDLDVELDADIAMLRVRDPIALNRRAHPACKAQELPQDYTNSQSIVSGWGTLRSGGSLPQILHWVQLPVISNAECMSSDLPADEITPGMVCAGRINENERDSCQGDSGGPLVVRNTGGRYEIVGLVSWGYGCADGTPGVYTRVNYYHRWVDSIMATY